MKKAFIQIIVLLALTTVTALSAYAQTGSKYKANIPFEFAVGVKTFPAGDYSIEELFPAADGGPIILRHVKSGRSKIFQVVTLDNDERLEISKLVFNRYEDIYFLAEINAPRLRAKFRQTKKEVFLAKRKTLTREYVATK